MVLQHASDEFIRDFQRQLRTGPADPARARKFLALLDAKRGVLRAWGVPGGEVADLVQEAAIRLLGGGLAKSPDLEHPGAWLNMVLRNAAIDFVRKRKRRRSMSLDSAEMARAIDREALRRSVPDDGAEQEQAARLHRAVETYAVRAGQRGRTRRGPEQVWAWYFFRVRDLDGAQVQIEMSDLFPAVQDVTVLWKWAQRGRARVEEIASGDEDRERGRLMASAARWTARRVA